MSDYAGLIGSLREKVITLLLEDGVEGMLGDDDSLVTSGLLDSLAVVDLATFMEAEFGIDFSTVYFDANQFETITTMADFVSHNMDQ